MHLLTHVVFDCTYVTSQSLQEMIKPLLFCLSQCPLARLLARIGGLHADFPPCSIVHDPLWVYYQRSRLTAVM